MAAEWEKSKFPLTHETNEVYEVICESELSPDVTTRYTNRAQVDGSIMTQ